MLAAPVDRPDGWARTYLPAGRWFSWWDGEVVCGPQWIERRWGLDVFPFFVREGAVVVLGPVRQHVGEESSEDGWEILANPLTRGRGLWRQPFRFGGEYGEVLYEKDDEGARVCVAGGPEGMGFRALAAEAGIQFPSSARSRTEMAPSSRAV